MANPTPHRLGQYEIGRLIGRGGMAVVYRARQVSMDREVAVKIIKTDLAADAKFVERFRREAHLVALLSHPHILKVFDYGQQGQVLYLVMELLRGGNLSSVIAKGPMPVSLSVKILGQIASALDYAHQKGLIHRDLKPENVLFDETGNAFLSDFGLAKLLGSQSFQTQTGAVMGTPAYMSPEQWRGTDVDARADIYALGILTFEMLTGQLPFNADTPFAFMHMHANEPPPSILERNAALPPAMSQIIRKALAKDPNERYQSAGALAEAVRRAVAGAEGSQRIDTSYSGYSGVSGSAWSSVKDGAPPQGVQPWRAWLTAPQSYLLVGGLIAVSIIVLFLVGALAARKNIQPPAIPSAASISTAIPIVEVPTSSPYPTLESTLAQTATFILPSPTTQLEPTVTAVEDTQVPASPTLANLPGKIAFVGQPGSTSQKGIYVINPDGSGLTMLIEGQLRTEEPAWSRDGKYIAFSSNRRDAGRSDIYVANADGSNLHMLIPSSRHVVDFNPAWSPDGKQIAFSSDRGGDMRQFDVFVVNIDGSNLRKLTKLEPGIEVHATDPTWSPDGKWIAFVLNRDGNTDIYVMDTNGASVHPLTNNAVQDTWPRWSPDGKHIAFYSNRSGRYGIHVMNADGSEVRLVTDKGCCAAWSPDSQYLAFSAGYPGSDIFIIGLDGSGLRNVTKGNNDYYRTAMPTWGP
jgi:serine/threonine protein kinase